MDSNKEKDNENDSDKICPICCQNLDNDIIKLKCGHEYHYDCIFLSYKSNLSCGISYNNYRECPYCRMDGGYLPLKVGYIPQKHIHVRYKEYKNDMINNNFEKWEEYLKKDKCYYILKTGVNSGKQCSKNKKKGCNYCSIHQKKIDSTKIIN